MDGHANVGEDVGKKEGRIVGTVGFLVGDREGADEVGPREGAPVVGDCDGLFVFTVGADVAVTDGLVWRGFVGLFVGRFFVGLGVGERLVGLEVGERLVGARDVGRFVGVRLGSMVSSASGSLRVGDRVGVRALGALVPRDEATHTPTVQIPFAPPLVVHQTPSGTAPTGRGGGPNVLSSAPWHLFS